MHCVILASDKGAPGKCVKPIQRIGLVSEASSSGVAGFTLCLVLQEPVVSVWDPG